MKFELQVGCESKEAAPSSIAHRWVDLWEGRSLAASITPAKHGVLGVTKSAALENAARGIRINAICPGLIHSLDVRSRWWPPVRAMHLAAMLKDVPIARLGRPEEIADAVLWLCSSASSLVVGHALVVDGGYTVR